MVRRMRFSGRMFRKYVWTMAAGVILALALMSFPAVPARADGGILSLYPPEGRIGDWVRIEGLGFEANKTIHLYFSSDKAGVGDGIDSRVTAYEYIGTVYINQDRLFDTVTTFKIPDRIVSGQDKEDVHGGDYYFYATYVSTRKRIEAYARFVVHDGTIVLAPDRGKVGTETRITGEGLRNNQKIIIKYDGDLIDAASGDARTNGEGKFTCTIVVPESTAGQHVITAIDQSGNRPEAKFSVEPAMTVSPTSQVPGDVVNISGNGFNGREYITITFDEGKVPTAPYVLYTNVIGSFSAGFIVPSHPSYTAGSVHKIGVSDMGSNAVEGQLTLLAVPPATAGINLSPATSLVSPGRVGMEVTVDGKSFKPGTTVTVTYSGNVTATVGTATTGAGGNFSMMFTVPPSVGGGHVITASDGTNAARSVFVMESEAPPMPVPLLPRAATTADARAHFDWGDVADPSGVTYDLQVATDPAFSDVVLEKTGLSSSEYTVTEQEKLSLAGRGATFYWRARAVDGAFNESEWTPPVLFYVGHSPASLPGWIWYILYGLGALVLGILGFWLWRVRTG